jgi:cellulose biosynthesis protein BcsQ
MYFVRIVVLASAKGGSSKTTLVAHLGVAGELAGAGPVVLVDIDPQGSLAACWNVREAEAPALSPGALADLPARLEALAKAGYALAVLDTPPAKPKHNVPLNFKMSEDFVLSFKTRAVRGQLKLNALLEKCFAAYCERNT